MTTYYDAAESRAEEAAQRQIEADQDQVMREMCALYLAEKPSSRETVWACMFCGREAGSREPDFFVCCGEANHVHEVYEDDGEPV